MALNKIVKHIAVVSPSFPDQENNGNMVPPLLLFVAQLKSTFPAVEISVVTLHYPFYTQSYKLFGVTVYPSGGANGHLVKRPLVWRRAYRNLKALHKVNPIDLIHSFWLGESALLGQKFSQKYKLPHFCTLMGQDAKKTNNYLRFLHFSHIQLIALSRFQKEVLERHTKAQVEVVIPWGIATADVVNSAKDNRPIDLICVSSYIPLKRVDLFINLVAQLKINFPDINAVIVGGGVLEETFRKQIDHLEISEQIQLLGAISRQEVLALMQQSKALIHTSSYEAQGYVINEALAMGCEVFALSKGFAMPDSKLHLIDSSDTLKSSVISYLLQEQKDFDSHIPLSMDDTIAQYQDVFKKEGLIL